MDARNVVENLERLVAQAKVLYEKASAPHTVTAEEAAKKLEAARGEVLESEKRHKLASQSLEQAQKLNSGVPGTVLPEQMSWLEAVRETKAIELRDARERLTAREEELRAARAPFAEQEELYRKLEEQLLSAATAAKEADKPAHQDSHYSQSAKDAAAAEWTRLWALGRVDGDNPYRNDGW